MDIGFIGLGKLGLDCAEVFAQLHTVRGYDVEPRHSDTVEICSLEETIAKSDWIFVAVPTPHAEGYDGSVPSSHMHPRDFCYDMVDAVIAGINQHAIKAKRMVLISTVLPGTTRQRFRIQLNRQHRLIYNPYLIAMGSVKWDMVNPEMVIIGSDNGSDQDIQDLIEIYRPLMQNDPRYVTGTWDECEAIKIFYNTFISAKVGLANMIQDFAMKIGNINVDVVTDALAKSTMRIMGPKYMTAGMGDAGACHPRDNIALRWLAQEYNIGYDLFDTIMQAREQQARNLAQFLVDQSNSPVLSGTLPIVIHGKAYKPDVPYCIGSYSTLVGFYVKALGHDVKYLDPLADDPADVIDRVDEPCVLLMAHNRAVTYGYTGTVTEDVFYCDIPQGSVIVDPWRRIHTGGQHLVVHYGNSHVSRIDL
jgi:UDPglucose 6-dehydrogenase